MADASRIPSAASFYVSTVPALQNASSLLLYAGNLPARPPKTSQSKGSENDAHLYFLLEKARHLGGGPSGRRRLVLWLNGGPGCSSFDGVMMEIGSFRPSLAIKGSLEWTAPGGAWNEYTDVLFLDQPVGTGFSYVNTDGYTSTLEEAANDVNYFLHRFLEVFPEYKKDSGTEFFIAGESFAGQYIPYTAHAILSDSQSHLDLQGIVIGNGAIDPLSQAGSELDMMLESGIWKEGDAKATKMKERNRLCEEEKKKLKKGKHPQEIHICDTLLRDIINESLENSTGETRCINIYDVRLTDTHPACGMNWPPTLQATYDYLARDDVREAFHVNTEKHPQAWIECSHRVSVGLKTRKSEASVILLPEILEKGVKVLLFAGDQDLICNHIGVERLIDNLEWGGQKGWGTPTVPKRSWRVNNTHAGYWQSARGLTYVNIANASHMVGFDKPLEAHDMMLRFMGVDLLGAAGPSALIQSSLEGETDRKLIVASGPGSSSGTTSGGLLSGIIGGGTASEDHRPMVVGPDEKTEAEVAEQAKWEAYYNAGSAALVVILILVTVGTCILLRLRRQAKRHGHLPSPRLNGSSGGRGPAGKSYQEMELERLVEEGEAADDEDEEEEDNDDDDRHDGSDVKREKGPSPSSGKHVTFEDRQTDKGKGKRTSGEIRRRGETSGASTASTSASAATPTAGLGATPVYRHRGAATGEGGGGRGEDGVGSEQGQQLFHVGEEEEEEEEEARGGRSTPKR